MKSNTKWIIGIAVTLLVICLVVGAAGVVISMIGGSAWQLETRSGQLWSDEQEVSPWHAMPMEPGQYLWMHPMRGINGVWSGIFSPLRIIGLCLLCLGFLALLVIGIVLLVRRPGRSQATTTTAVPEQVPAPAPAPSPAPMETLVQETPAAATKRVCPNCAQSVEADWSHCPYCGAPQG